MKDKLKILAMIIFGIIIGIFSKYSDTSGKTFSHYFGILSSGIFFWFFIATLIYFARNETSNFGDFGSGILLGLSIGINLIGIIITVKYISQSHKKEVSYE